MLHFPALTVDEFVSACKELERLCNHSSSISWQNVKWTGQELRIQTQVKKAEVEKDARNESQDEIGAETSTEFETRNETVEIEDVVDQHLSS